MRLPQLRVSLFLFLILIAIVAFAIQGARVVSRSVMAGLAYKHSREELASLEEAARLSRDGSIAEAKSALTRAKSHGKMKDHYTRRLRTIP